MSLASQVSALATRVASYLKTSVVPRLLPSGGAQGKVLVKTSAGDYATGWSDLPDLNNMDTLRYNRDYRLNDGEDIQNVGRAGFYDGSSLINAPDGGWYHYDARVHSNGNSYMVMTAFPLNHNNGPFWRIKNGGSWGAWNWMWSSNNFDPNSKLTRNNVGSINFQNYETNNPELMKENGEWMRLLASDYTVGRWSRRDGGYFDVDTNFGSVGVNFWTSDANLKENISRSEHDALSQISSIPFVDYNFRRATGTNESVHVEGGFLAQELELINPNWVNTLSDEKKSPNPNTLITSALRAIQQMHELAASQSQEIAILRERMARLEA